MEVEQVLIEWWKAMEDASGNTALLLADTWSEENSKLCTERMTVLRDIELVLYSRSPEECESPLKEHLQANNDKPCSSCQFSSRMDKIHPDCVVKMSRWFDTKRKLLEWVYETLVKK